jgi:hypothetical protein
MAKMRFKEFEFEGTPIELAELSARLNGNRAPVVETEFKAEVGKTNGVSAATWRWNEAAVEAVVEHVWGKGEKVLRAFVEHGREMKYKDLCKLTGLRGLQLVGPLSGIRKHVKKAIGHDRAKLIESRWVVPGDRDERIYSIHSDAYEALCRIMKKTS